MGHRELTVGKGIGSWPLDFQFTLLLLSGATLGKILGGQRLSFPICSMGTVLLIPINKDAEGIKQETQ